MTVKVPLTLKDFIERAELVYGDRVAVVDEPDPPGGGLDRITYSDFGRMARNMASRFNELGAGPGERVAILSPNSARFLLSLFGVSAYGRILVPINYRLNSEEIRYIVDHSGASVLLVDPDQAALAETIDVKHKFVFGTASDEELFGGDGTGPTGDVTDEDSIASINYTSGTTARPKGVELVHRGLWLNATTFGWHTGVSDRDVYLHTLPTFHCNGWGMPYATTGMGVRQVIIRKIDGEDILKRIDSEGVTLMCGAPAVINMVLDAAAARREAGQDVPGRDLVRIVVAGAPPPTKTIQRVADELGWEFIQIYGLTETSPLLTINRARSEWDDLDSSERAQRLGRAGVPAIGVQLQVDGEGEVMARSNNVMRGYWNQPEETERALPNGEWFRTGDGGDFDGAYLAIVDRKKDVIITGGENVSSIEIEDTIFSHPDVTEVAVIGVPDDKWGETIKALVVLREGAELSEADLVAYCRERLAGFKTPRSVEFRDALPRTATGKLQKFLLRKPYWEGHDRQVG